MPGVNTMKIANATRMSPRITLPPTSKGMRADVGVATDERSPEPPGCAWVACSFVVRVRDARLLFERWLRGLPEDMQN